MCHCCCGFPTDLGAPCAARPWWNPPIFGPRSGLRRDRRSAASPSAGSLMPLVRDEARLARDRLCIGGRRRSGPSARRPGIFAANGSELFAKPDDFWEVNNVVTRCREVVEQLEEAQVEFERAPDVSGQTQ